MSAEAPPESLVIAPVLPVTLPVAGRQARFPVRRVYCVGRNYAAHAVEMGHDPQREPPFFFQKNPDDLQAGSEEFRYPPLSRDVHHEVELMVALQGGGSDVPVAQARDLVFGYGVALDMTRRDLQAALKAAGRPWEAGKAFEGSAPCSALVPAEAAGHPERGAIRLRVNGALRQSGDLAQMIWSVPEIIAELSRLFVLAPGDVILTGTPAGVAAVARGDLMEAEVEGLARLAVRVV